MNGLFVLISIAVLSIGVTGIIASSILKLQRMRLEEAKLRAGDPADVSELGEQVSALQHDVAELQERVDFAERLLTQVRDTAAMPAALPPHQQP